MNDIFNDFVNFYNDTILKIVNQWDYVPVQVRNDIVTYVHDGLKFIRDNWSCCEVCSMYNERKLFVRDPHCFENVAIIKIYKEDDGALTYYFYMNGFNFSVLIDYEYEYGGTYIYLSWKYKYQKKSYSTSNQKRTIKESK